MSTKTLPPQSSLLILVLIVAALVALSKITLIDASGSATAYAVAPQTDPLKVCGVPILTTIIGALCVAGISRRRKSPWEDLTQRWADCGIESAHRSHTIVRRRA